MPNPGDRTTHDGHAVDWLTKCALLEMELRLGYRLTIVQGSYSTSTPASVGTHSGAGAADLAPYDWANKVKAARQVGFAAWHRPRLVRSGVLIWNEHVHMVMTGNPGLSPAARTQVTDYFNGLDGLADHGKDTSPRPHPLPTYKWPGSDAALALARKATAQLDVHPLRVDGVDLSNHNTVTQTGLVTAKHAGVRWAYHKATEGATFTDTTYGPRRTLVHAAGLRFGAYHFARPGKGDAVAEARHFLNVAKPRAGDMRPMLDVEDSGSLTRHELTAWVGAWTAEVKRQTGVLPIIYTSFDLDDTFGCMLWTARYSDHNDPPKIPAPWKTARIRQFSDGVYGIPRTVAGLSKVDLNTMPDTDPTEPLDWFLIPVKVPTPPPPPPKPPVPPKPPAPVLKRLDPLVVAVDPMILTLSVVVANIKCNPEMPQNQVEEDVAAIKGLPTPGAAALWFGSEIEIPRYTQAWERQLGHKTLCAGGECPITLGASSWDVLGSAVHILHEGRVNVTPPRILSVVRGTHVNHPDIRVAPVAKHMVSGAFSNNYPDTKAWRRAKWDEDFTKTQDALQRLVDDGYTVIVGGDYNRAPMPDWLPGQVHLFSNGVQHLAAIPAAGHDINLLGAKATRSGDLHTDHPAIVATFTIT